MTALWNHAWLHAKDPPWRTLKGLLFISMAAFFIKWHQKLYWASFYEAVLYQIICYWPTYIIEPPCNNWHRPAIATAARDTEWAARDSVGARRSRLVWTKNLRQALYTTKLPSRRSPRPEQCILWTIDKAQSSTLGGLNRIVHCFCWALLKN